MDRKIYNEKQKIRRALNNNADTKKYEKTENGFIMRMYRNMKSRISGVQKQKYHLYADKYLMPKEEFYAWAKNNDDFKLLFNNYKESNYSRKLAPSVDRLDSSRGYEIDNMQFVTHSENSRRGTISRFNKKNQ